MGSVADLYPQGGNHLKAVDIQGQNIKCRIESLEPVQFPPREDGQQPKSKLVVSFVGAEKTWVMGPTVAREMAAFYGDDWTQWVGIDIELFTMQTNMGPGIRFRPVSPPKQQALPVNDPSQARDGEPPPPTDADAPVF